MCVEAFASHLLLYLKVIPKSSRQEIVGMINDRLKIKITTAPEAGKANKEVIALLSDRLGISKSAVSIVQGETTPLKTVKLVGISKADFVAKILHP